MTSPMIRYWEKMTFNYCILALVAMLFAFVHLCLGKFIWFYVGLGVMVGSVYIAVKSAYEVEAQVAITKALENAKKKQVDALYGKENNDV